MAKKRKKKAAQPAPHLPPQTPQSSRSAPVLAIGLFFLMLFLGLREAFARLELISSMGLPRDYNGFYYLHEITHRLEHSGRGYYHDFNLFFSFAAATARFFSLSPLQTINTSIFASLFAFAAGVTLLGWNRKLWYLSSVLFYLAWQSEPLFFLHYGLLKQTWAQALFVYGLLFALAAPRLPARRIFLLSISAACFVLAAVSHVFIAGVTLLFLAALMFKSGKAGLWKHRWILAGAFLLAACSGAVFLYHYPKPIFSSFSFESKLPWDSVSVPGSLSPREKLQYQLYFFFAFLFVLTGILNKVKEPFFWISWVIFLTLSLPIWSTTYDAFWIRFMYSAPPFFLIGAALALQNSDLSLKRGGLLQVVFLLLFLIMVWAKSSVPAGPRIIGPGLEEKYLSTYRETLKKWIPPGSFVQAPMGVQFMITYFLGRPAATRLPEFSSYEHYFEVIREPEPPSDCLYLALATDGIPFGTKCVALNQDWSIRKRAQKE